ncbi:MAG: hypothetical protein K2K46_01505 [Lachnospiraceae bacterium]|nr:hypothetical protein [Lachnospiraceae bacterium]
MEEVWYKDVAYEDAKELVKENLVSTVAAFIASGYWLKYIRDNCDYKKDGYQNLWECAEAEFGLGISEASRAMSMNDKYSTDGNSPFMAELYKQYNKSQLQEMLTMSDEQLEQVTPDMTVKAIREIKNQKPEDLEEKEQKLEDLEEQQDKLKGFIYDFVWVEYMKLKNFCFEAAGINVERLREVYDGKLVSGVSCNFIMFVDDELDLVSENTGEIIGKYSSDAVASEINDSFLRLKEQRELKIKPEIKGLLDNPYCSVCGAALNPPDTENMSIECSECGQAVEWKEYIEKFCDVATDSVNTESEEDLSDDVVEDVLTEIEMVSEQEEPLSVEFDTEELMKEFEDDVIDGEYIEVTEDVWKEDGESNDSTETVSESENVAESDNNDLSAIKHLLSKKNKELKEYLDCEGIPENTIFEKKTIVAALANMVCELEDAVEVEQPELPKLKNNEQRKAWLEAVEAWGLWYEDRNIQARYYKYDFSDGSRLIAVKYRYTCPPWLKHTQDKELDGSYKNIYYHMIYSEEYRKNHKYEYEEYYTNSTTSISSLVEFVKEIAKKASL